MHSQSAELLGCALAGKGGGDVQLLHHGPLGKRDDEQHRLGDVLRLEHMGPRFQGWGIGAGIQNGGVHPPPGHSSQARMPHCRSSRLMERVSEPRPCLEAQ